MAELGPASGVSRPHAALLGLEDGLSGGQGRGIRGGSPKSGNGKDESELAGKVSVPGRRSSAGKGTEWQSSVVLGDQEGEMGAGGQDSRLGGAA